MQRLRILFATVLLSMTGLAVFGVKALASPASVTNPVPPQACSTGSSGSTGSPVTVVGGTLGYTGFSGTYSGSGATSVSGSSETIRKNAG